MNWILCGGWTWHIVRCIRESGGGGEKVAYCNPFFLPESADLLFTQIPSSCSQIFTERLPLFPSTQKKHFILVQAKKRIHFCFKDPEIMRKDAP